MKISNTIINGARKPTELEETAAIEQVVTGMGEETWKAVRIVSASFMALSFIVTAYKLLSTTNIVAGSVLFVLSGLWFFIASHRVKSIDLYARKLDSGLVRVVECTCDTVTTPKCYYRYIGFASAVSEDGTKYYTLMPYKSACKARKINSQSILVAQIIGEKSLFSFLAD